MPVRVSVVWGERGAREAGERGAVAVLVDALRASVTITAALVAGAQVVRPVLGVEEAKEFVGKPGVWVAGERGGAKVEGFDFGNSPTEILAHADRIAGSTVILTTSNGTRCVRAALAGGAHTVLVGALPNATAVAEVAWQIARDAGRDIALIAAGRGDETTEEDAFAAALIGARLAVHGADVLTMESSVDGDPGTIFSGSASGQRLSGLGYEADVILCARLDLWTLVPVYVAEGFVPWKEKER